MMKKIQVCDKCGSPRVTYDALVDPNNDNEVVTIFLTTRTARTTA